MMAIVSGKSVAQKNALKLAIRFCCALAVLAMTGAVTAQERFSPTTDEGTIDGRRVALVIGISNYAVSDRWPRLPNAVNDTQRVKDKLQQAQFELVQVPDNATKDDVEHALREFAVRAVNADVALFYFAGHGFQFDGKNYLVPSTAPEVAYPGTLRAQFIPVDEVVESNTARVLKLFVFDACRVEGPVLRDNSSTRGDIPTRLFGSINLPQSVVLYSTSPGARAYDFYDDEGRHSTLSPFAAAFTAALAEPGLPLTEVLFRTKQLTNRLTEDKHPVQSPQDTDDLARRFYFHPPITTASGALSGSVQVIAMAGSGVRSATVPPRALGITDEMFESTPISQLTQTILGERSAPEVLAAATTGDSSAQVIAEYMYAYGTGVPADKSRALAYLERAANKGAPGKYLLSRMLMESGADPDVRRGLDLLRAASNAGFSRAQSDLAFLLTTGSEKLLKHDPLQAVSLWRAAAAKGDSYAVMALNKTDGFEATSNRLQELSAKHNVAATSHRCQLGYQYGKVGQVIDSCLLAANEGIARGQAILSLAYANGWGVPQSDEMARNWARLAINDPDLALWPELRAKLADLAK